LDEVRVLASSGEQCAAGWELAAGGAVDEAAFESVAGEEQAGARHVAELAQERFVDGAARTAGAAGEDEVQAEVGAVGGEFGQGRQGIPAVGDDEVVVVDDHEDLRSGPPVAFAQLPGRDIRSGKPLLEGLCELSGVLGGVRGRVAVGDEAVLGDLLEMRAAVVDEEDAGLGGRAAHDLAHDAAQERGLAGLRVAEDDQVRVGREIDGGRAEVALGDADDGRERVRIAGRRGLRREEFTKGDIDGEGLDGGDAGSGPAAAGAVGGGWGNSPKGSW
jgi:hypothetical protein